jgi:hypothetical protein
VTTTETTALRTLPLASVQATRINLSDVIQSSSEPIRRRPPRLGATLALSEKLSDGPRSSHRSSLPDLPANDEAQALLLAEAEIASGLRERWRLLVRATQRRESENETVEVAESFEEKESPRGAPSEFRGALKDPAALADSAQRSRCRLLLRLCLLEVRLCLLEARLRLDARLPTSSSCPLSTDRVALETLLERSRLEERARSFLPRERVLPSQASRSSRPFTLRSSRCSREVSDRWDRVRLRIAKSSACLSRSGTSLDKGARATEGVARSTTSPDDRASAINASAENFDSDGASARTIINGTHEDELMSEDLTCCHRPRFFFVTRILDVEPVGEVAPSCVPGDGSSSSGGDCAGSASTADLPSNKGWLVVDEGEDAGVDGSSFPELMWTQSHAGITDIVRTEEKFPFRVPER